MRSGAFLRWMGFGLVAVGLLGCAEDELAPEFPEGSGQAAKDTDPYPAGPYGISIGSVIANYKFVGFVNAMAESGALQEIRLSDFYNPTGTDVFSDKVPLLAGTPKPKALVIDVSSVWCPPCNEEAATILPAKYLEYKPRGGEFLLQLADGPTPGEAAGQSDLYKWTQKYDVDYPAAIDPSYKLGALFDADAFPANIIIKTQDMSIVEVIAGEPNAGFWSTFEQVLDGTL